MRHGLVIGKFYPPHSGHHHLIVNAAAQVDRLSVLVLGSRRESISVEDRVGWLSAVHPGPHVEMIGGRCDVPMDLGSDPVWSAQVAIMRATLQTRTSLPVDVVFSGEAYGPELARRFDAQHVAIGPRRVATGVSGTGVRRDLAGTWDLLHPVVRAGLTTRVVVLGAESTGTTTVSRALAESYRAQGGVWARTQWVPEYGREHTVHKHAVARDEAVRRGRLAPAPEELVWDAEDFGFIAQRQTSLEEAAARDGSPLLVCDTDALATRVWERRYVGPDSRGATEAVPVLPPRAIYLLTDHVGVPFVQDGWRDGQHVRAEMSGWFIQELTASGQSWALLSGSIDERIALAHQITDEALSSTAQFADPIGAGQSTVGPGVPPPTLAVPTTPSTGRVAFRSSPSASSVSPADSPPATPAGRPRG